MTLFCLLQNGFWLSECVHLSTDSSYTASLDDGVILEGLGDDSSGRISIQAAPHKNSMSSPSRSSISKSREEQKATVSNYVVDIQVTFSIVVDLLDIINHKCHPLQHFTSLWGFIIMYMKFRTLNSRQKKLAYFKLFCLAQG